MAGNTYEIDGVVTGTLSAIDAPLVGRLSNAPGGASDYNDLTGKPTINTITVEGDKLGADYRLQDKMHTLTQQEIEKILYVG